MAGSETDFEKNADQIEAGMMYACQVIKFNEPYVVREVPIPKLLRPYDLLIKTGAASFCHTDEMVRSGAMGSHLPITASHEGAGMVIALGDSVKGFTIGDRVLSGIIQGRCNNCDDCNGPDTQYCARPTGGLGIRSDGALAEYFVTDSREASLIPDNLEFTSAAPLACAGISVWRGLKEAGLSKGQWLGIVGSGGGLGHLGILFAKAKGWRVVAIDVREKGLDLSRDLGADVVCDANQGKDAVSKEIFSETGGKGVAATINVSDAPSAAALACAITAKHGRMIQIAQPPEISFPFSELIFRDIHVIGSMTGSRNDVQSMLQFVAESGLAPKLQIYRGLAEVSKLMDDAHSGRLQGKGVVVVDETLV